MFTNNNLPEKSLYKADEICKLLGIKPYVLRFWETEFDEVRPLVSSSGKKMYEKRDIYYLNKIKGLLFDKKLTVEKARAEMKNPQRKKDKIVLQRKDKQAKQGNYRNLMSSKVEVGSLRRAQNSLRDIISITASIKKSYNWG